ncbi:sulfotransferase 1E1-like [Amphiura filiformis]|uniref:sulfotransferase 1E1-like n=1 Tax=Amphiura filiformis TaxID=82378 RepID=UPI003B2220AE
MAGTLEGQDKGSMNDFQVVDGINVAWVTPPSTLEAMKTFEVREDDIFIVTYPKSGTHWLMEIVYLVLTNGEMDKINRCMMEQGLEFTMCAGPSEVPKTKPGYKHMEEWESPRVMVSHLMHRFLPPQIWEKKAKIIYVMRNPKDVLCSMHSFMYALMPDDKRDWNNFVEFFLDEGMTGGDWFRHVHEYWTKCQGKDNFLFVKFEEVKKDHRALVKLVADFLGKDIGDEMIDKITSLTTIDAMRETYDRLEEEEGGNMRTKAFGMLPFLNKGHVGGWKERLSEDQNKIFDDKLAETFKDTGLTFDFELKKK